MPSGAAITSGTAVSTRVVGNIKLSSTATTAAKKVPNRYNTSTGLMLLPSEACLLAIAEATSTNTNKGAIAFNALTNKVPNKDRFFASSGDTTATSTPNKIPIIICGTKPSCNSLCHGRDASDVIKVLCLLLWCAPQL